MAKSVEADVLADGATVRSDSKNLAHPMKMIVELADKEGIQVFSILHSKE
ncbi:MAG: hypothetical protein M3Y56_03760 [Armatimonadota bacterium]|nr:hypothetical protein [Armatimonadota bacterium]